MKNEMNDEKFVDTSMITLFNEMKKEDLVDLAGLLDYSISSKLKKAEFIDKLVDELLSKPEGWLMRLTMFELNILQQLSKNPSEEGYTTPETFTLFPIEEFLFVVSEPNEDDTITYHMCNELRNAIAPCIDKVIAEKKQLPSTEIEQFIIGYVNLRGFCELLSAFVEAEKHYPDLMEGNPFEIIKYSVFLRKRMFHLAEEEGIYMIDTPYLEDPAAIIEDLLANAKLDPKEFSKDEMLAAANYPVPTIPNKYADETREALMNELNIDADKANWYMLRQWVEMQKGNSQIPFSFLLGDVCYNSKAEFDKFFSCLVDYQNNAPRWIFNGLSSVELGNKSGRRTMTQIPRSSIGQSIRNMGLEMPDEMQTAIEAHYEDNQYGTKIGRNEPCLCGSGKKFKKCCGNN